MTIPDAAVLEDAAGKHLTERQPGEKTCDYLGRFSIKLADAALVARERGDDVHALFFAIKAAETLKLAKLLGYRLALSEDKP